MVGRLPENPHHFVETNESLTTHCTPILDSPAAAAAATTPTALLKIPCSCRLGDGARHGRRWGTSGGARIMWSSVWPCWGDSAGAAPAAITSPRCTWSHVGLHAEPGPAEHGAERRNPSPGLKAAVSLCLRPARPPHVTDPTQLSRPSSWPLGVCQGLRGGASDASSLCDQTLPAYNHQDWLSHVIRISQTRTVTTTQPHSGCCRALLEQEDQEFVVVIPGIGLLMCAFHYPNE